MLLSVTLRFPDCQFMFNMPHQSFVVTFFYAFLSHHRFLFLPAFKVICHMLLLFLILHLFRSDWLDYVFSVLQKQLLFPLLLLNKSDVVVFAFLFEILFVGFEFVSGLSNPHLILILVGLSIGLSLDLDLNWLFIDLFQSILVFPNLKLVCDLGIRHEILLFGLIFQFLHLFWKSLVVNLIEVVHWKIWPREARNGEFLMLLFLRWIQSIYRGSELLIFLRQLFGFGVDMHWSQPESLGLSRVRSH